MNYVQRVQPRSIGQVWPVIKPKLHESTPPMNSKSDDAYAHILAALLDERAQLWVVYNEQEQAPPKVHAFVVTIIRRDPITNDRFLHLYAIYAYRTLQPADWDRLQDCIEAYARGMECIEMTAFTSHPVVRRRCEERGGVSDVAFLHKRL